MLPTSGHIQTPEGLGDPRYTATIMSLPLDFTPQTLAEQTATRWLDLFWALGIHGWRRWVRSQPHSHCLSSSKGRQKIKQRLFTWPAHHPDFISPRQPLPFPLSPLKHFSGNFSGWKKFFPWLKESWPASQVAKWLFGPPRPKHQVLPTEQTPIWYLIAGGFQSQTNVRNFMKEGRKQKGGARTGV